MNVLARGIAGALILEPRVFEDHRGFFLEAYNRRVFREATGLNLEFVQDNHSRSVRGVLRGLHYQIVQPQGKLVRVTAGEIWDVAVDLRRSSPTFGRWEALRLSAASSRMLWIPAGFAHGFLALSEHAEVQYKTTDYHAPAHERTILWNDPQLAIEWPLDFVPVGAPILADKDLRGSAFRDAEVFA